MRLQSAGERQWKGVLFAPGVDTAPVPVSITASEKGEFTLEIQDSEYPMKFCVAYEGTRFNIVVPGRSWVFRKAG
jgi:hypothetical protein